MSQRGEKKPYKNMVIYGKYVIISLSKGVQFMTTNLYKGNEIIYLSIDSILPNPYQTRVNFRTHQMKELVDSVKKYGVLQPISVRLINNKLYELVFGERRLRATRLAGLNTIPAIVVEVGDRDAATITMSENLQRMELNYIEIAEGLKIMRDGFKYSINEICHILSISQDMVSDYLEFCKLSSEIKSLLIEKNVPIQTARVLLKTDDFNLQKNIIDKAAQFNLDDEKVGILMDNAIINHRVVGKIENSNKIIKKKFNDIRLFTNTIKQAVGIMNDSGMDTRYEIEKDEEEYLINIKVKM